MASMNINTNNFFFETILREVLGHDKTIQDVELIDQCDKWVEKAQNFYSNITKLTLKYTYMDSVSHERIEKRISLIMKEEPSEGSCLVQVRQSKFFETEIDVLRNIIPTIESYVDEKISPLFIYGSKRQSIIIMENLIIQGFINKDCKLGLSKAHTLMVIERLAKFHAGSVALNEAQTGVLSRFNRYDITEQTHANIFKNIEFCTRAIGEVVRNLSDERCAQIAPKFEKLATKISQRLINITKYDKDEFCVLNQGDCWMNNIMFHEDENGEPMDVRLIDFQISVWSSPAIDLLFFLSTCPDLSIKWKEDDLFLKHYLNILIATMRSLKCKTKPPTIDELKSSMYKRRSFAVKSGLIFYSKLVAGDDNVETIDEILENDGSSDMAIFYHPNTIEVLKKIIPLMDDKGFLD